MYSLADTCPVYLFTGDVAKTSICEIELEGAKVKQFKDAIDNSYWFEFFMGMPVMIIASNTEELSIALS